MNDILTAPLPLIPWETPALHRSRERLSRAGDALWRVIDTDERILGHIRVVADPLGIRYRSERLHLATGVFRLVGEFWDADDAVASLRT